MSKAFDMDLFLSGVLVGSHATRQRHLRQANLTQAKIAERWERAMPWACQHKHLVWFLENCLSDRNKATRYYYTLTARLIARCLEKAWIVNL